MDDPLRKLVDDITQEHPEQRPWYSWCFDEYDPVNPYHDAWFPDGIDAYTTEDPNFRSFWGACHLFASMPDAQLWVNPDGRVVSLVKDG